MKPEVVRKRITRCIGCELSSRAGVHPVPWAGPVPARIAIVGEAPGYQENAAGRPFVLQGASGKLLRESLGAQGIEVDECFVCNTVSCFPDAAPTVAQQHACRIHLKRQLVVAQPEFILSLGAIALNFFDPDRAVTRCHGKPWRTKWGMVFPTFHPAGAMRDPERRDYYDKDIIKFAAMVA